jgi:hypothetical protein
MQELVKGLNSHTMEKQSSQVDEEYLQERVEKLSNDASQWLSFFSQTPSPESTPSQTFPESATEHSTVSPKISVLEQETAPRVSGVMEGAATASRRPQTTVEREQEEDFVVSLSLRWRYGVVFVLSCDVSDYDCWKLDYFLRCRRARNWKGLSNTQKKEQKNTCRNMYKLRP